MAVLLLESPRKAAKVTTGEYGNGRVLFLIRTKVLNLLNSTLGGSSLHQNLWLTLTLGNRFSQDFFDSHHQVVVRFPPR